MSDADTTRTATPPPPQAADAAEAPASPASPTALAELAALDQAARALGAALLAAGRRLVTAESCTGGMVSAALTEIAGSSAWFERGYVTYSNEAKHEALGVDDHLIGSHGAVSEAVAAAMASGALAHSHADLALSITGIAGPGGAVPGKPVGTVCFGWQHSDGMSRCETRHFDGDRGTVRRQAALHALRGALALLGAPAAGRPR
ncbi:CinA family protein [Chitinasiproducens palmae]|uniref:Nicotinamide-nucleotide amidase n=1 Tax=Chitinasiproducens palmae TaxID=1770053 RepID=A0A1H2PRM9_9BURK|nr:CinA family protein [Chitinasiproducens palmae]SDV49533.1 nicotinamide-nucleotide amidase [Chitinasiproducens palmae]